MSADSIWITGYTRSGKTTRLVEKFRLAVESLPQQPNSQPMAPQVLVLAANRDSRIELADRIAGATDGQYPVQTTTPLGFFLSQVFLFWPLLIERLNLRAQFPIQLRPETEQELATQLWRSHLDSGVLRMEGTSEYRLVRRTLDLLSLAAAGGTPIEDISSILERGMADVRGTPQLWDCMGESLLRWRDSCLERGLLSYGLIYELYWRHLVVDPVYQTYLARYRLVLADDVDEYPAIARQLFEFLLDRGAVGVFTYNPAGGIRLGLGADPKYLGGLASRCRQETLALEPVSGLAYEWGDRCANLVLDPMSSPVSALPPESVQSIQTVSRAQLLRQTAETIVEAVRRGDVEPQEIAAIAPGLDAIARYTLIEILTKAGIDVEPLNEQRPLTSSPLIRALLTLLALVYPGLGRLLDRDAVAEMLVVLSQPTVELGDSESSPSGVPNPQWIDPVRAGLLADRCYAPDRDRPRLLPVESFPRWDRLGHRATVAYNEILQWVETQQQQLEARLIPSPIVFLDRAIQRFLLTGNLAYHQLAAIRELMETAQHYWDVRKRLQRSTAPPQTNLETDALHGFERGCTDGADGLNLLLQFIQLLRQGTVTANPFPVRPLGSERRAVTLATVFQYRSSRRSHRWHFWLDAGSSLWTEGGSAILFGAPLFLQDRLGRPWTSEDGFEADEKRLKRILLDLLGRVEERLYLCHSDLAVNGQEQTGPLLGLVNAAVPFSRGERQETNII